MSSEELEALARSFTSRALAEEAKIDESKDPLPVRLGKALGKVHVKIPEFVAQWAKRGKEPITKMEFRQNVRKLLDGSNAKEVDALFESLDDDKGGTLDIEELSKALSKFRQATANLEQQIQDTRSAAQLLHKRSEQCMSVAQTTRDAEQADARLEELRNNKSCGARLGVMLVARNLKVADLVKQWDPSGDGDVDKDEFRHHVTALGIDSTAEEIDALFSTLDEDGGGSLDMHEIKMALKTLKDQSEKATMEVAQLKKSTVELLKTAKVAQAELKKQQQADEVEVAAKKAKSALEAAEREAKLKDARAAKVVAQQQKRAAEEAERKAFEQRVLTRRAELKAQMAQELNMFQAESSVGSVHSDKS